MTKELLDTLDRTHRVCVGQNWLTAPRKPIATAIADILRSVLPEQEHPH